MMQELLGGERKICISSEGFLQTTLSPCPSARPPSSSAATATTTAAATAAGGSGNPEAQSLRCPRCDSNNTKFCYYNNYNLTQPRHFCKTCRRYWTKGGALRNVPIGGGCRKNKSTAASISITSGKSSASPKLKSSFSISEIGKQIFLEGGFDHQLVWSPPQNSHVLALLRAAQSPTPSQLGAQISADPASGLGMRSLSLDSYSTGQVPSVGMSGPLWRSNQQPNGVAAGGEPQNSGIQELLQRLKTSTSSYYYGNHQPPVLTSNTFSSSSTNGSSVLESAPVSGGDFGYFNSPIPWTDVATPSGAYP